MATTASTIATVSNKLREELSPTVRDLLPAMDPVFSKIKSSSIGVKRDDGIGRTFYIYHTLVTSLAGAFQWKGSTGALGMTMVGGSGNPWQSYAGQTATAFPGISTMTMPGLTQTRIQLVEGYGNIAFPHQLLTADQLSASVLKYVGKAMKLFAQNITLQKAISFYATDTYGSIGTVSSTNVGGGNAYVDIHLSAGRVNKFFPGQVVDMLDSTGAYASLLQTSTVPSVVERVNYLSPSGSGNHYAIRLVPITDGTDSGYASLASGDLIVPYSAVGYSTGYTGPSGLEDWIDNDDSSGSEAGNTIMNVNLDNYPQLRSIEAAVSDSLTEALLDQYFGSFDDAYAGWVELDTILTTGGVTREFVYQLEDTGVFQRNGQKMKVNAGFSEVQYSYNGRNMTWMISRFCPAGYLYGLKLGDNNITRYVPPRVPGTGSQSGFDGDIQWFSPLGGSSGIFKHAHNGDGATTEMIEAPMFLLEEYAPTWPQSIKLTGLTEQSYSQ